MQSVKRILVALWGLAVLAAAAGLVTSRSVKAEPKANDVRVVNTAAEAVPVTLGNAAVPVTLGNATVPVSYSNTRQTPVFVDAGDTAHAGVSASCTALLYDGQPGCRLAHVPTGQILVIETLSCGATIPLGGFVSMLLNVESAGIPGNAGNGNVYHVVPLRLGSSTNGNDYYRSMNEVRLYAVGGSDVSIVVGASANSHDASCAISGYLVNQ